MRLVIADDHPIFRRGLEETLRRAGHQVVAAAADGAQAVEVVRRERPEAAVLDLSLPVLDGIQAAAEIRRSGSAAFLVAVTIYDDERHVLDAVEAGMKGYVLKTQAADELLEALSEVARGGIYLSPGVCRHVVDAWRAGQVPRQTPLSPRERQVLVMVADGLTTQRIADTLGISFKTADAHRSRLMKKLGVHGTAGLVRYAIRNGHVEA